MKFCVYILICFIILDILPSGKSRRFHALLFIVQQLVIYRCVYCLVMGKCIAMRFDSDSIVCRCNATYCDEIPQITPISKGKFHLYTSTSSGLRFLRQNGHFSSTTVCSQTNITIDVRFLNLKDEILGFGGSITDSAGLNIQKLSEDAKTRLIESYYSPTGIEYSMGRIPMGATDFSRGPYSYAEVVDDNKLEHFALKEEDYKLKASKTI